MQKIGGGRIQVDDFSIPLVREKEEEFRMKKFSLTTYTEWAGDRDETITKVFAILPEEAKVAIAEEENWTGCHWDDPAMVFSEQVEGLNMTKQAKIIIKALNAEECIDDGEEDEEVYTLSPLQQWLIDQKS